MTSQRLWQRGCVQVYTGEGKGKTTAAVGLAVRAAGAGLRVYFTQFCKGRDSGEHAALARFADLITLSRSGSTCFIIGEPTPEDVRQAQETLTALREAVLSGEYDVVIADELNVVAHLGLVRPEQILGLLAERPSQVELVITGRDAFPEVIAAADLVTEMCAVKHPYEAGVGARKGIEF